jgi:hypothetical protein
MYPPKTESVKCRTCPTGVSKTGKKVCVACQRKVQQWLDGGYSPTFNGVIEQPADTDNPRSFLDRALMQRNEE